MHAVEAVEQQQEDDRDRAEAERHRNARHQHQQRRDENESALRGRAHGDVSQRLLGLVRANSSASSFGLRPKGGALPVTRQIRFGDVLQDQQPEARPASTR